MRIEDPELQHYLARIAHSIVLTSYPEQTAEELLQEMNLYILERAEREPAFLKQARGYISRAAAWHARDWCRDQHTDWFRTLDPEAGDWICRDDPDVGLCLDVRAALEGMGETAQEIARLMTIGYRGKDLERATGRSKQNLHYYRKQIKRTLAAAT